MLEPMMDNKLEERMIYSHPERYPDLEPLPNLDVFPLTIQPATQAQSPSVAPEPDPDLVEPPSTRLSLDQQETQLNAQFDIPSAIPPARDGIDSMPTQMLAQSQTRVQPQSYQQSLGQDQPWPQSYAQNQALQQAQVAPQNQMPPQAQVPSTPPKRRLRVGRIIITLVIVLIVLGGAGFGIETLLQKLNTPTQPVQASILLL
jgi:hypothetical protein